MSAVPIRVDSSEAGQVQLTPKWVLDLLGPITLDPCTEPDNPTDAAAIYTKRDNGLIQQWVRSGLVFINPPFREIFPWAEKISEETLSPRCRGALLVPFRGEMEWFHLCLRKARFLHSFSRRVHYEKAGRVKSSCPFPSCLFLFGSGWEMSALCKIAKTGTMIALNVHVG